jgi:hypothetical protein
MGEFVVMVSNRTRDQFTPTARDIKGDDQVNPHLNTSLLN